MRQLTFGGFTKRYVMQLSATGTTAIYSLAREAATQNLRLREPLFLYAASNHCMSTLLAASKKTELYETYRHLADTFSYPQLMEALETKSTELPERYHKVWRSYRSEATRPERDARVKQLIAVKVRSMQAASGISIYRVCKDLCLNTSNVNTWLKNNDVGQISLDNARRVLAYFDDKQNTVKSRSS